MYKKTFHTYTYTNVSTVHHSISQSDDYDDPVSFPHVVMYHFIINFSFLFSQHCQIFYDQSTIISSAPSYFFHFARPTHVDSSNNNFVTCQRKIGWSTHLLSNDPILYAVPHLRMACRLCTLYTYARVV